MQYDLVFEGGGAKGMVFVGAMQEFERRGHTYKRLLGTSAGAITAALLAAGYTASEMMEALAEKEDERSVFSTFLGRPGPFEKAQVLKSTTLQFLRNVDIPLVPEFLEKRLEDAIVQWLAADARLASSYSFLEYGGVYSADHFIAWMKRRLDTGTDHGRPRKYSEMRLKEFFDATGYDLTLVAADTTGGAMLVLNHRTAPRLPLVWAVRMSMSIPLLWQEVVWQEDWGDYRGRKISGHAIVDGGLLSNFPIELFISQDAHVKQLMGQEAGEGVLGMLIDEDQPVEGALPVSAGQPSALNQAPVIRRIANLLNTSMSAHDKMVSEAFERLVVRLPAHGYGTTEFEMSDERRAALVEAGRKTMAAYLDRLELFPEDLSFSLVEAGEAAHQADRLALKMLNR